MNGIRIPGVLYSMLLAAGVWAVDYFTTGGGSGLSWATIALAAIPVILKIFTVNAPEPAQPQADFGGGPLPQRDSKARRLWLG